MDFFYSPVWPGAVVFLQMYISVDCSVWHYTLAQERPHPMVGRPQLRCAPVWQCRADGGTVAKVGGENDLFLLIKEVLFIILH